MMNIQAFTRSAMMNKLACTALAALATFSFLPNPSHAVEPEFVIKYQFAAPSGANWIRLGSEPLMELITKATKGRVGVKGFPPGTLSSFKDLLRSTGSGIVDMSELWLPALPGKFPLMELFSLPGLSGSQSVTIAVYLEMLDKYPQFGQKFTKDDNVVELFSMVAMRSEIHTNKPIKSLADLKGMVIACQGETSVRVLKLLGASGTIMIGGDAYLAAQRKVVDGVMAAWGWVNAFKIYEVTKYHTLIGLSPGSITWVMNKDTYNKFTDDEKLILDQLRKNSPANFIRANVTNVNDIYTHNVDPKNIFKIPGKDRAELRRRLRPLWDLWVKKVTAMGHPGQKMLDDAVRLMDLYATN